MQRTLPNCLFTLKAPSLSSSFPHFPSGGLSYNVMSDQINDLRLPALLSAEIMNFPGNMLLHRAPDTQLNMREAHGWFPPFEHSAVYYNDWELNDITSSLHTQTNYVIRSYAFYTILNIFTLVRRHHFVAIVDFSSNRVKFVAINISPATTSEWVGGILFVAANMLFGRTIAGL